MPENDNRSAWSWPADRVVRAARAEHMRVVAGHFDESGRAYEAQILRRQADELSPLDEDDHDEQEQEQVAGHVVALSGGGALESDMVVVDPAPRAFNRRFWLSVALLACVWLAAFIAWGGVL